MTATLSTRQQPDCHSRYDSQHQPPNRRRQGYDPAGAQPDLLRPALEAAGVIPPEDDIDDLLGADEELSSAEEKRRVLKVVGEHFGLSPPRQVIENGQLPAVVTRTSPPSSW